MLTAAKVQALYAKYMAKGADMIGGSYNIYRPTPNSDVSTAPLIGTALANFSPSAGYNRPAKYDDVLWNTIIDPNLIRVGDILVGDFTYFVANMDPLVPIGCVRCTGKVTQRRENDQAGSGGPATGAPLTPGGGHFFGQSRDTQTTNNVPGEQVLASNIPALLIANAGRATGNGELPDDAPGPARWRIWTPASVLPQGSIQDRDRFVDGEGRRYLVSAAQWTPMGYRSECIRLEM